MATIVRRTNSLTISRKPSVKTKPEEKPPKQRKAKHSVVDSSKSDDKMCVRAKVSYLETPQNVVGAKIEQETEVISDNSAVIEKPIMGNVKATIEIFERRTNNSKPKVPEKNFTLKAQTLKIKNSEIQLTVFKKDEESKPVLPQRKCDSMYEVLNVPKVSPQLLKVRSEEAISSSLVIQPNSSFLWRGQHSNENEEDWRSTYDVVEVKTAPDIPPRPPALHEVIVKKKMPLPQEANEDDEKIYEELHMKTSNHYEQTDDGYEYCSKDNIYESVPPLPPRPPSRSSTSTLQDISNCYESIYSMKTEKTETEGTYESIYQMKTENWSTGSNRDSLLSSDQQSNSMYGKAFVVWGEEVNAYKTVSLSSSERSDEWIDLSEAEEGEREVSQEVVM